MDFFLGTALFASFLGGVVALLAPCCVSVMLPAYFASTFRRRSQILGMTLIFAAGLGTVILPLALGASILARVINGHHTTVFTIGGIAMVVGGVAMLFGGKFMLPMPSRRGRAGQGLRGVFGLGAFSGVASACCAPVLAGVAALSGAAASFPAALAVGVAYVFGMVAPLTVLALVWDRRDWGSTKLLSGRTVTWRFGNHHRQVPISAIISGSLLLLMGLLTIVLAFRRQSMGTDGWQVRVSAGLTHASSVVRDGLSWVPAPVLSALVLGALLTLVVLALRSARRAPTPHPDPAKSAVEEDPTPTTSSHGVGPGHDPSRPAGDLPRADHAQPLVKETH